MWHSRSAPRSCSTTRGFCSSLRSPGCCSTASSSPARSVTSLASMVRPATRTAPGCAGGCEPAYHRPPGAVLAQRPPNGAPASLIPRLQLFEIEDQAWCPAPIRDAMTDFLRFLMETFAPYRGVAAILSRSLRALGEATVVDLCSGGGGPWLDLVRPIRSQGGPDLQVRVTDWFPNQTALARLRAASAGAIAGDPDPVSATAVPARLAGFRTLFTALHHFPPRQAHAILADAVRAGQGIAAFEVTSRSPLALLGMLFLPLLVLLFTPL